MRITVKVPDFSIDTLNGPIEKVIENLIDIEVNSGLENIWIKVDDGWGIPAVGAQGKREATQEEAEQLQQEEAKAIEARERKELARLKAKYDE